MRSCPTVDGNASPLITHRIGVDVCMARQRGFYHKCHRCLYRGKAVNWEPSPEQVASLGSNGSVNGQHAGLVLPLAAEVEKAKGLAKNGAKAKSGKPKKAGESATTSTASAGPSELGSRQRTGFAASK